MTFLPAITRPQESAASTTDTPVKHANQYATTPDVRTPFASDVIEGLSQQRKRLHCKHLYDRRGSQLFDKICELPEYYPTRTELAIMHRYADAMAEQIGPNTALVELGSGSSQKTRVLLDHLREPTAYLPVDISRGHLLETADKLRREHPGLNIQPIVADFTQPIELPSSLATEKVCVYFPGSTIGNLEPHDAVKLLKNIAELAGNEAGLLIGFDLQKDHDVLHAAYNDLQGVTAAFNLNLLHRINREANGNLIVDQFSHHAIYNASKGRIEISIESKTDQTARIAGQEFHFSKGELIHTEYSHKYTQEGFANMAASAGLTTKNVWTDPRDWFAVNYLESKHGN